MSWLTPLVCPVAMYTTTDEGPHSGCSDEWAVALVAGDGTGLVAVQRHHRDRRSYWWAVVSRDHGPLHVLDTAVPPRSDPLLVKGAQLWAEMVCEEPMAQWTIGNETIAVMLSDASEALGPAYGDPTPVASDLEFYGTADVEVMTNGYVQRGCVHGVIEIAGRAAVDLVEVSAVRWHRWVADGESFGPPPLPAARAHLGIAAMARVDNDLFDLVLTTSGWCRRGRE